MQGCDHAVVDPDMPATPHDERQPMQPARHRSGRSAPTISPAPADDHDEASPGSASNHPDAGRKAPTLAEVKGWPATVDVPTAGSVFGLSRSHSYELIKRGEFPTKVIQVGSRYRVITDSVVCALSDGPSSDEPLTERPN
jgi:hypothetical protein